MTVRSAYPRWIITAFLSGAVVSAQVDSRACYWPDGSRAGNYLIPCNSKDTTMNTHCCWAGEVCMSNSLCYGPIVGVAYRGACTDRQWKDKNCPSVCTDATPNGSQNLWKCAPPADQSKWDCGKNTSSMCKDSNGMFDWPVASIYKIAGDLPRTSTVDRSGNAVTATSSSSANSTATSQTQQSSSGSDNSVTLGVGLGLGIPLAIALVVLALWMLRERKLRRVSAAHNADAATSLMRQSEVGTDKYGGQPTYAAYESGSAIHQSYPSSNQHEVYEMPNERPMSEMQTPPVEHAVEHAK